MFTLLVANIYVVQILFPRDTRTKDPFSTSIKHQSHVMSEVNIRPKAQWADFLVVRCTYNNGQINHLPNGTPYYKSAHHAVDKHRDIMELNSKNEGRITHESRGNNFIFCGQFWSQCGHSVIKVSCG